MQLWHVITLLLIMSLGYAIGRYFPGPGQMVGLP